MGGAVTGSDKGARHPASAPGQPWVTTGNRAGQRLANLNAQWVVVRRRAGLEDVRIHDLRHSFASSATGKCRRRPAMPILRGNR